MTADLAFYLHCGFCFYYGYEIPDELGFVHDNVNAVPLARWLSVFREPRFHLVEKAVVWIYDGQGIDDRSCGEVADDALNVQMIGGTKKRLAVVVEVVVEVGAQLDCKSRQKSSGGDSSSWQGGYRDALNSACFRVYDLEISIFRGQGEVFVQPSDGVWEAAMSCSRTQDCIGTTDSNASGDDSGGLARKIAGPCTLSETLCSTAKL